jgi:hypothetical protein
MAVVGARARMRPERAQRSGSIGRTLAAANVMRDRLLLLVLSQSPVFRAVPTTAPESSAPTIWSQTQHAPEAHVSTAVRLTGAEADAHRHVTFARAAADMISQCDVGPYA